MNSICILLLTTCGFSLGEVIVTYTLTTKINAVVTTVTFTKDNYMNIDFNPNLKYKFLCDGWRSNNVWFTAIIDEYLKKENIAIIATHYGDAVNDLFYIGAVCNVFKIGDLIGKLILGLNSNKNICVKDIHCIGFSLGAHVCGIAGKTVKQANKTIARITGLDAARPGFYTLIGAHPADKKLTKFDADFVDAIHTACLLGTEEPIAIADFFPNCCHQPGCDSSEGCNHLVAIPLFINSINKIKYEAHKCDNCLLFKTNFCNFFTTALMGDPVDVENAKGTYHLNTNNIINDYNTIFGNEIPEIFPFDIDVKECFL